MSIPLFKVHMPQGVENTMTPMLYSGYVAEGDHVRTFEQSLKTFLKNDNVITTNSCTHSIQLALKLAGVSQGDYVYCTPMTCVATAVPIANLGAIPVWVDVDPKHGMITRETLLNTMAWAKGFNDTSPKCLIYVCWGGDLGPIQEVADLCKSQGITLIIDAAQAFGVNYNTDSKLGDGQLGDYVCFSFQAIKHITTGDGGALAIKDSAQYKRAFRMKWFGIDRDSFRTPTGEINWKSDIPEIGYKFHMNNLAGVLGCAQMNDPHLESRLDIYRKNDAYLTKELYPLINRTWTGSSASWVATFECKQPLKLQEYLLSKGILASQMHVNVDIYTGFAPCETNHWARRGVEGFMNSHLCLPCGWWVDDVGLTTIVDTVKEFYIGK